MSVMCGKMTIYFSNWRKMKDYVQLAEKEIHIGEVNMEIKE